MKACPRLRYSPLGGEASPWPDFVQSVKRDSGIYAIRDKATHRVLYVGSSGGRLYDTITRHFQQWKRDKKWWSGLRGGGATGHDPGVTYARGRCELAIMTCRKGDHLAYEAYFIDTLKPRDNLVKDPAGEKPVPF